MPGPADEIAAGAGGRAHMRASHADREQVIGMLKAAFVQGRLAKDEFDLRVGQVLASRTYADLGAVTADIPAGPVRAHSPNPARKPASMPMPTAVRGAVGLMCAGAVLTLADVGIVLVTLGGVRWAAAHDVGAGQWPFAMLTRVDFWLVSAPVGAGVWLWLAWANGRGYQWARAGLWRSSSCSRLCCSSASAGTPCRIPGGTCSPRRCSGWPGWQRWGLSSARRPAGTISAGQQHRRAEADDSLTSRAANVPAACPMREALAGSHGRSRSNCQDPSKSQDQQVAGE